MRALDNASSMSTSMLKQRNQELSNELALVSKKNVKLKAKIWSDKFIIIDALDRRK